MFNSNILDILIACVVVLLVLSLIVQAIQTGIKKLLKLKSRQIEDSLVDLFQMVLNQTDVAVPASTWEKLAANFGFIHSVKYASDGVRSLYAAVSNGFVQLGRVSSSGGLMLDDLEKSDLLKVLGKIAPGTLLPNLENNVKTACDQLRAIQEALNGIDQAVLAGDTSAKFAVVRAAFAPLINDFLSITNGENLRADLLIQDISRLRSVNLNTVITTLGEIQAHVATDLATAKQANPPDAAATQGLQNLATSLSGIAADIAGFQTTFDAAIAPLRTKLEQVESWFDTVMQSFDERYGRAMKTWAIGVSCAVVICLNANVFDLYRNMTSNATLRNALVQDASKIADDAKKHVPPNTTDSGTAGKDAALAIYKETKAQVDPLLDESANFGFRPLWPALYDWCGQSFFTSIDLAWFSRRAHDAYHLLGWAIMVMLLSVGAPFWEDTLESLFGLKNLLRTNAAPSAPGSSTNPPANPTK